MTRISNNLVYVEQDCGYSTPCWIWQKSCNNWGYGMVWEASTKRVRLAHRVAYELVYGPIPIGMDLDHLCRVRQCCNPAHVEAVTRATNLRRGSNTKLTANQVIEIRSRSGSERTRDLAREFGVADCNITNIVARRSWKDI